MLYLIIIISFLFVILLVCIIVSVMISFDSAKQYSNSNSIPIQCFSKIPSDNNKLKDIIDKL
jgi:hypothetical protein